MEPTTNTSQMVAHALSLELLDEEGTNRLVPAEMRYDLSDPCAVTLSLRDGDEGRRAMDPKYRSDQATATPTAPRPPERRPDVFHRAVEILRAKHHVSESLAYEMLVRGSMQAQTTVRETATKIIAQSLDTP